MARGDLIPSGDPNMPPTVENFLSHPTLPQMQQWVDLDRLGNWLDVRESIDGVERRETRVANAANAYISIDAEDPELQQSPDPTVPATVCAALRALMRSASSEVESGCSAVPKQDDGATGN